MRNKGIVCVYFKVINLNYGKKAERGYHCFLMLLPLFMAGRSGDAREVWERHREVSDGQVTSFSVTFLPETSVL